jgi:hypothetical protein
VKVIDNYGDTHMSVIHDALAEAMGSYTATPTGYYVNYSLHRWGDGSEPFTDYYIGPHPKVVAEFLREYYLPTLSTYDGEYNDESGRGSYVVLGGDKKPKPTVLARIGDGYEPGPNPSREAILLLIKQALSGSSILGAYVELQHDEPRSTAKEVRVRYNLHYHCDRHEWQVQHNFRKENGDLACGSDQFLRLWWAPMEYVSVKYYPNAREVGEVGLVLKGDELPTFPWWLVEESWRRNWGSSRDIRNGYRCLFVHIAIGYGTSAVLGTFPVEGSTSEHRAWFIDKLMGIPPDSLRIRPYWQDIDTGSLHQWPAIYRSYLVAALPLEGIRTMLEGPIEIDMAGGTDVTGGSLLLSIPVPKYPGGCDGELLLLEGRHWVVRTADGVLCVDVTPHSGKYRTTTTESHTEKRGSITVRHIKEECRCMYQELVLSGDITIVLGSKVGPIPIQKITLTVIDTVVGEGDDVETVHNPGITITVGDTKVAIQKLVRSNWDTTHLYLEGVDKSVPFDLLHRAAWSTRMFRGQVYESGLL